MQKIKATLKKLQADYKAELKHELNELAKSSLRAAAIFNRHEELGPKRKEHAAKLLDCHEQVVQYLKGL